MMLTFFLSPFCISTPCTLSTNLNEMSNSRDSHESLTSLESSSSLASSRVSPAHVDAPIPLQDINQQNAGEEGGGGEQQNDDENNDIANAYFPDGDERNLINSVLDEKIEAKPTLWRKVLDVIWPNYILNHLDYASFKIVCRSWCHVWSCAVLTIIPRTYYWLGNAAYLIVVLGFLSISGGSSIIMNVLASCAGLFGMMIAFVHHVVRSKIINDLNHGITSQELAQQLIQEGSCQMNDQLQACVSEQIFTGRYITTKAAAISILSIISFTFIVGNIRQHAHPLWTLAYIGGQFGSCIFTCYGHFSPLYQPLEIGLIVLKPFGLSLLVKVLTSLIVYPTTSNWLFFQGSIKFMTQLQKAMDGNTKMFKTLKPSAPNFSNYKAYKKDITKLRSSMAPSENVASTIWLEYSYGRFDVGDVGEFRSLLKNLISSSASYAYFYQLLQERTFYAKDDFAIVRKKSNASSHLAHGHAKLFSAIQDSYKKVGKYESEKRMKVLRNRIAIHGAGNRMTLGGIDEVAKFMSKHFTPLLEDANLGIQTIIEWLEAANEFRIYAWLPGKWNMHVLKQKEINGKVFKARTTLKDLLRKFEDVETMKKMMVDSTRSENEMLFLISQGVLFLQIAKHQCENILKILDLCLDLDERRPEPKFITFFTKNRYSKPRHLSSDMDKPMPDYLSSDIQERDADNLPPANAMQFFGLYFTKLYSFFISNKFWFWIKAGGLITIGAIPYFVRTTAGFYYHHRMIWLVIMIAVSISENTGSTIYVFCAKLVYTFFGAIVGMIGWYIACGNGNGNYYGYGAVTAVLFVYFVYFRHFSVHQTLLPQNLFAVTAELVMGTSWIDAKLYPMTDVKYGFEPAYLRFIGVTIGLCIGSLAAIIPSPVSSKALVRKILADGLSEVGNIHCSVTKFALKRAVDPHFHTEPRHDILLAKFRYLLLKVARLSTLLVPLKFELPISGYWPESKYLRLQGLITDVTQLYLMLLVAFNELEDPVHWLPTIFRRIGFCYAELEADIFATVHMAADALRTKEALPKITDANISVKHMELLRKQWGLEKISLSERFYSKVKKKCTQETGHDEITKELDYDKFFSNDGKLNIVSLLVAHMIYNRLDEIIIVVKGLVGEIYDLDENVLIAEEVDDDEEDQPYAWLLDEDDENDLLIQK